MRLIDDIMNNKARRKVILTGAVVGAAALLNGFGRSIDSKLPGYKRSGDSYYLFARGALIGGALAVPGAALLVDRGVDLNLFGAVTTPPPVQRPTWHDFTVPVSSTPLDHMRFTNDIDGTTYFLPKPAPNN